MRKKRTGLRVLMALAAVILLCAAGCAVYLGDFYRADDTALAAMAGTDGVRVEDGGDCVAFIPEESVAGMIFYPGGKVQPEAYAPLMQACAQHGILCVLMRMPGNLAVLAPNAADGVRAMYPQADSWYMAGHSLGGAMAANSAREHADEFDGLVLLAAYSTGDISASGLRALSLYGENDGVMNRESYEKYRANLPEDFTETVIAGGNHAQFGAYGEQDGDGAAAIPGGEQIACAAEEIARFIEQ